mmetsp:Transcript_51405/g.95053  ORF Transcript_51405/g.95053 Transcript_51405/m.95053 type:complete len:213 (+) Transcript_51405:963-1601(+)
MVLGHILLVLGLRLRKALTTLPPSVEALAIQRELQLSLRLLPCCTSLADLPLADHHAHSRLYGDGSLRQGPSLCGCTSLAQKATNQGLYPHSCSLHLGHMRPSEHSKGMALDGDSRTDTAQCFPHETSTHMALNGRGGFVKPILPHFMCSPACLDFGGTSCAGINPIAVLHTILLPSPPKALNLLRSRFLNVHALWLIAGVPLGDDLVSMLR